MSVKVLKAGMLATIQDLGRYGSQKFGVVVGGAMDSLAVRIGNQLVGNREEEAVIEITMFGTELLFQEEHVIALTGGNLDAQISGKRAPLWRPVYVEKGDILKFNRPLAGARAYVAILGGIEVPLVMGSKSTYTQAKIGGYAGRQLREEDVLTIGALQAQDEILRNQLKHHKVSWTVNWDAFYQGRENKTIRIMEGSEFPWFTEKSQKEFLHGPYKITPNANRVGYQLTGKKLETIEKKQLISEGVTFGTIQVPAGGEPIILMADRQTTGGYPKIAQVISADLPRLAQFKPGDEIYFQLVTLEEAEKLLLEERSKLNCLHVSIELQKQKLIE